MIYNLFKTAGAGSFLTNEDAEAPALEKNVPAIGGHAGLERKPILFTVLALVVVAIGGLAEILPTYLIKSNIPTIASVKPYTPLELQGRDIYIREGCVGCHSQMVRPFRSETERYGEYSKAGEFVYDHPFLWGSRRTGPDLAREGKGNKNAKPHAWHYKHLFDPRITSPGSIMPMYPWLLEDDLDISNTAKKINAMRTLGVPYQKGYEQIANDDLKAQAKQIADELNNEEDINTTPDKEIIALIAYLQRLGTDILVNK
jgi:cytochrome c oxidase cbb3-type subunit I/II